MKILFVIPARGGSKGIPKKNVRLMNGKPLIYYAIDNALQFDGCESDIVVDTDDDEIARIAAKKDVVICKRPAELATDDIPLDPVICHAYDIMTKERGVSYDYVVTLQATSPTLRLDTLKNAINEAIAKDVDTMISVVNRPHLSWRIEDEKMVPNYKERKNRQYLPAEFCETGGFLISKGYLLKEQKRIGEKVDAFLLSEDEAIDIDDIKDWVVAESLLKKKKVILRSDGYASIGM